MAENASHAPQEAVRSWLLPAKAQWPGIVSGYYRREDLLRLVEPLRTLTVLRAPSGFGKTSLLADVFRRWQDGGQVAAWLTVDEDDRPGVVDAYLALAFEQAGLRLQDMEDTWRHDTDAKLPHRTRRRTELLTRAIKAQGAPCLLVLDDVERLAHPEAADTISFLLQNGPPNLRMALAMRDNPGLDLSEASVDGKGVHLAADHLRFSAQEIDRFFSGALSLRDLVALEQRTEGWPVALRILRNLQAAGGPVSAQQLVADRVSAEWFGERLLRDLSERDRNLLLDIALFEWITPSLAKDVLREDDIRQRIESLATLEGLLQQREDDTFRLNPLLREYCAAKHRQQHLAHFQTLHRRIAEAEAREGHVVQALRHAGESGDAAQIGKLLEDAGGVRLWARFGVKSLIAVNDFLTPEVIEASPRVALVRCTVLVLQSRFAEALAQYNALKAKTRGFERDRAGGDNLALHTDHILVLSTLAGFNCLPFNSPFVREGLTRIDELLASENLQPVVEGALNLSLSIADGQRGRLEKAHHCGLVAKAAFDRSGAGYGGVFINLALGTLAMAQGRVRKAAEHYSQGAPTAIADILSWELEHERSCSPPGSGVRNMPTVPDVGWLDVYAAAHGVTAEVAFDNQAAIFSVDQARERARKRNLATVARFLSALRINFMVRGGLTEQAEQAWREDSLPTLDAEILDLDLQSWREMEALACGRVRLLAARGDFATARGLLRQLCQLADERSLRRVLMNGLALSTVVEYHSGQMRDAEEDLADFLRVAEETDYYRPLARDREVILSVLPSLLRDDRAKDVRHTASALVVKLNEPVEKPIFSARELAILRAFGDGAKEDAIAKNLGMSEQALRLELDSIHSKIGAQGHEEFEHVALEAASTLPKGGRRSWRGGTRQSRF